MNEKMEISWKAHPLVDDFPKSIGAIFLVIVFSIAFGYFFASPGIGGLSFIILFLATLTYFVPVYYHIDEQKLTIKFLFLKTIRPLRKFKNYYHNSTGVNLSTFSAPSRLDAFRGNYLRFNHNQNEVLEFLKNVIQIGEGDE
ncbi:hypothetical protein J7L05_05780 [bacterium]|nr:hypothetical protein [bacterium]